MDEAGLVERMKCGDKEAFGMLYDMYKERVFRTACLIAGNQADGEDIAQETFLKAYVNCRMLRKNESFRYWLFQILNRTAWNVAGRAKREQPQEEPYGNAVPKTDSTPLLTLLHAEQTSAVWQAVAQLSYKQRATVILYYYNELSTKEIAHVMDCMEGTVKSRLFTARKQLKKLLPPDVSKEGIYYEA